MRNEKVVKKPKLGVIAKKIRKSTSNFIPILIISIAYGILFLFLHNKILFTPDFGESDAYHINIALKQFLSISLKNGIIPVWTDMLSGGFPILAESQIGALFLPNILFLTLLPFSVAYNMLFIFSLFSISIGFFLLLKEMKVKVILALLFSFIFLFNGSISLRWVHLNLIQAYSLTPFLFYLALKYLKTNNLKYLFILALIISQMIFAGYMPIVYISCFGLYVFFLILLKDSKYRYKGLNKLIILSLFVISGFIIALPQILPTIVFSQFSGRQFSLAYSVVTAYPFPPKHIISFFFAYLFGNPKIGTYPLYSNYWGIFWENTPYVGWVFLILLVIGLFEYAKYRKQNKTPELFFFATILFILLALGKFSPLYFLFTFPPFNFFRTQARYLILSSTFLILAVALLLNNYVKRISKIKVIFIIILCIGSIIQVVNFSFSYHIFVDKNLILKDPEIRQYIKNTNSIVFTFGQEAMWNSIFLKKGWSKESDINKYLFYKNFLFPNSNMMFRTKIYDVNTGGYRLRRPSNIKQYLLSELVNENISDGALNTFRILGVQYIISSKKLDSLQIKLVKTLSNNSDSIFLYQLNNFDSNLYYVPEKIQKITYFQEFEELRSKGKINIRNSVSEEIEKDINNNQKYNIDSVSARNNDLLLKGLFKEPTLIVFRKNAYPEWEVKIDGKKTKTIKVNLVHFGLIIPKGSHSITVRYRPNSFYLGMLISILFTLSLSIFVFSSKKSTNR